MRLNVNLPLKGRERHYSDGEVLGARSQLNFEEHQSAKILTSHSRVHRVRPKSHDVKLGDVFHSRIVGDVFELFLLLLQLPPLPPQVHRHGPRRRVLHRVGPPAAAQQFLALLEKILGMEDGAGC